jgi:translocation and assembly module TamA
LLQFPANLLLPVMLLSALGWSLTVAAQPKPNIEIKGGSEALRENVRHFLPLYDEACNTPPWRLRSLLRESEREIIAAGQALGYYHLTFEHELTRTDDCWNMVVTLTPGDPVLVQEVRIVISGDGVNDPAFQRIQEKPDITKGDQLNHGRYETLKNRFTTLAANRGYFDGKFQHARVAVNVGENAAMVELVYDTGPRYRIGTINIEQDILNDGFVQRYIEFKEGDYYNAEELLELKSRYNNSNFFSTSTIAPDLQDLEGESVPINISLEARKRYSYSVGAGVATDTGPRLLFGFEDRYISRRGHSLTADLSLSEVTSTFETAYSIPMTRPAYEYLKVYTGYESTNTDSSRSDLYKVGSSYTRFEDNDWLYTYALNYEREDSAVGSEDEKRTHLIIPSVSIFRTEHDGNISYPRRGWNLLVRLSGSPETLGSSTSFVQLHGRAKYIHPLGKGRLLLRAEAGMTEVDELKELPASVRFFAGGDASVRGYDYESLGPKEDVEVDGEIVSEVVGGNNLLVTSVEYDYLVRPKWAIAAFYDQGNAGDDFDFDFARSVGLGVRWISPIGPVRIDVAKALDEGRGWALHLSMGPDL